VGYASVLKCVETVPTGRRGTDRGRRWGLVAKAVGGVEELAIATSRPNDGAVRGFKDRTVLEYSQVLGSDGIRAASALEVPDVFRGS